MPDKPEMLMIGAATPRMQDMLSEAFNVTYAARDALDDALTSVGERIEYALLGWPAPIGAAVMDRMPNLKILSNFGVGYDAVDVEAAKARGILVTHTPDVLNDEVANTAILLMLAAARNFVHDEAYARSGRWAQNGAAPLSHSVRGKTVGIVGLGRIGLAIAQKLTVFGTNTVYHARSDKGVDYPYYPDLLDMARASDILIVITPGGAGTHHLINADVITALGPQGSLVNVSRGSVVDEIALIQALEDGTLGSAGLDVFENEPHIPDALKAMSNVVLLPHVGSATKETRQAMGDLAVDNLLAFLRLGRAITPVPECK